MNELANKLNYFFDQWRQVWHSPVSDAPMPERLQHFFNAYRKVRPAYQPDQHATAIPRNLNPEALQTWLDGMQGPIKHAKRSGSFCDPWQIAGLKRDEVRNSGVLAWILDPNGSHGCGELFLNAFLAELDLYTESNIKSAASENWSVMTEISPSGFDNRVDILLSNERYYIIVEIKIGASEGDMQLERYHQMAKEVSWGKEWYIVFLTIDGKNASTIQGESDRLVPMSWSRMAHFIGHALRRERRAHSIGGDGGVVSLLVDRFVSHIRKF